MIRKIDYHLYISNYIPINQCTKYKYMVTYNYTEKGKELRGRCN